MIREFVAWVREFVACSYWGWVPAPLWALFVSPLLGWALGCGVRIAWPRGASRSPFRRSFWYYPRGG